MKLILLIVRFFSRFIKKDKNLITILFRGFSGSNISPIIDNLKELENYKINILRIDKYNVHSKNKREKIEVIKERYIKYKYVLKSQLIISTHGFYRLRNDNYMINLWHGIPLKAMSLMNKSQNDGIGVIKDNYIITTSEFCNTLMNACLGIKAEQYCVTGYPRNDYLFNEDGHKNLENLIDKKINEKIILYMPTYKDVDKTDDNNLFEFPQFDYEKFNKFLEDNRIKLILKLHPNDERIYINKYSKFNNNNIILLKSEELEHKKMDLYKILNAVDLLITDYSSVFLDFLLLNRPMIFTPVNINEYRKYRGFLLEPYDFWTPGPKCFDQDKLQFEILKCINDINYYKNEREIIKNIVHKYQDCNSTQRVIQLIHNLMNS